ncbi:general transcription factor II-I repeat domain-containing protein 2-like [Paramisgurnus dabryanus]|uniref:general transcription factor II-I repeat domain-containing protein 2-like n=1 Tax=Paramisgurnus dabryanus TaxID=90735 RepID=UPI003CCF1AD3
MATKKRKVDDENRTFNPAWESEFAFLEVKGKPVCLICQKTIAVLKRANLQRHHEQLHPDFKDVYPPDSNLRKHKIQTLRDGFQSQQSLFHRHVKCSDSVTEASFKIAWNIAKAKKPATEGEFLKNTFMDCAETLFSDFKNKDDIIRQISKLQLSDSTITRRVEVITDDLFSQLLKDIERAEYFSLALDECTDGTDIAQLMVWVRFLKGEKFAEEMLTLLPLKGQTRGEDIYSALKNFFHGPGNSINLKNLVSVTTDGAPSMVGKEKGLIALLRKDPEMSAFFSYHCILHQEQLCSKLRGGALKETMDSVVRIVNFILAHALKHRQFRSLVEECESAYGDLAMHAEVRWLSRGKVLCRFMQLLPAVRMFLEEKGQHNLLSLLNDTFIENAAFLTDITCHLNSLNLKLQGRQKILPMMFNDVSAFETKLDLFVQQLKEKDLTHFPVLQSVARSLSPIAYCPYITELKEQFSRRFADIKAMKPVLAFTENPFACDVLSTSLSVRDLQLGVERAVFEEQLIDLQHNTILKERHKEESADTFWISFVPKDKYPALFQCAQKILTCFGSTYVCESSFSAMGIIKSKLRFRLTDRHLTDYLRAATSEQQPELKVLVKNMQTQISH